MSPIAPAIIDLGSWAADIGGRLVRGIIADEQAEAELEQRYAEAKAEIAAARARIASDRAKIDAAVALLPHAPPPAGGTP